MSVPFSYINVTLLEIRSYEDAAHPVHTQIWSQNDDPLLGSRYPTIGRESRRPSIRNIVRLKLGSGVERSFVLTQVRLGAKAASRITLIFPIPIERAMNPVYDYAAIAAIDYAANQLPRLSKERPPNLCRRLCTREWEGNGTTGRRTEIIASHVQFLGAPPSDVKAEKPSAEASLVAEAEVPF